MSSKSDIASKYDCASKCPETVKALSDAKAFVVEWWPCAQKFGALLWAWIVLWQAINGFYVQDYYLKMDGARTCEGEECEDFHESVYLPEGAVIISATFWDEICTNVTETGACEVPREKHCATVDGDEVYSVRSPFPGEDEMWDMSDNSFTKTIIWMAYLGWVLSEIFFSVFEWVGENDDFYGEYVTHDLYKHLLTIFRHTLMFFWLLPLSLVSSTPAGDCFNYEPLVFDLPILQVLTWVWSGIFFCMLLGAIFFLISFLIQWCTKKQHKEADGCMYGCIAIAGICMVILLIVSSIVGFWTSFREMFWGDVPIQDSPSTMVLLAMWAAFNGFREKKDKKIAPADVEAKVEEMEAKVEEMGKIEVEV